jgi:hypothetical protein
MTIEVNSISKGKHTVIVDDNDAHLITHSVNLLRGKNTFYANMRYEGKPQLLHRIIMGFPKGYIDHIDGNGLNNSRNNLRVATHSQNNANKGKTRRSNHKYKGVYYREDAKAFRVQFMCNKKFIQGGYFKNEDDAAREYNRLASEHLGEFAKLNIIL